MGSPAKESELSIVSLKSIFRLPFQGTEWPVRMLIGILLLFAGYVIPIIPWLFISGYGIRIMRQAIEGQNPELPPWDDWGQLAWDGLRAAGISWIFLLPGIIVFSGGFGFYFLSIISLPVMGAAAESGEFPGVLFGLTYFLGLGLFFLSLGIGNILIFVASLLLPPVTAHFAATNRFGSFIEIRTWFRVLWRNKLGYFIAWVIGLGIFGILYLLFIFGYFLVIPLCLFPILMPLAIFLLLVVLQALFGETYREGIQMVD